MENILSSAAEVKNIIEAVSFRTGLRYAWLKGDGGLFKHPFGFSYAGEEDRVFPLDLQDVAGDDPDRELLFADPPDLQPGEVAHYNGAAVCFSRPAKPGEIDELRLAIWRARAAAAADPERARPAEITMPDPARDNVVDLPGVDHRAERHNRPPRGVLKYSRSITIGEEWKRLYAVMYERSWFGPINQVGDYAGKSTRKGRYFTLGNKELARSTGLHRNTVSKYLMILQKNKLILRHRRGYPKKPKKGINPSGKSYLSIWELPFNLAQVFAWRRKPAVGRHRSS